MKRPSKAGNASRATEDAGRRTMLKGLATGAVTPLLLGARRPPEVGPETVYELRVYHLIEGKLPLILKRFQTREVKIFERLGMHPVAFWTPTDAPDAQRTLVYLLRHPSREAANAAWKAFSADPEWLVVKAQSEKDGPFVAKHESTFLKLTSFSPVL